MWSRPLKLRKDYLGAGHQRNIWPFHRKGCSGCEGPLVRATSAGISSTVPAFPPSQPDLYQTPDPKGSWSQWKASLIPGSATYLLCDLGLIVVSFNRTSSSIKWVYEDEMVSGV